MCSLRRWTRKIDFHWTEKRTRHDRPGSWLNSFAYLKNSVDCLFIVNIVNNYTIFIVPYFFCKFFLLSFKFTLRRRSNVSLYSRVHQFCGLLHRFFSFFLLFFFLLYHWIINSTNLSCFPVHEFDKKASRKSCFENFFRRWK